MIKDYSQQPTKSKLKKDYIKKEFVNPYFADEKKKKFNTKKYLKILVVILIIYLVMYSDLLKIETVEIDGFDMINEMEFYQTVENNLDYNLWYFLPQRNMLFLSKNRLEQSILNKYNLKNLEIDKGWKSLKINLQEKTSHLIIFNNKDQLFYFSDLEGVALRQVERGEVTSYWEKLPILNVDEENIIVGQRIISVKMVNFIINLDEKLKTTPINIQGYERGGGSSEITVVIKEGWRVYLDVDNDLNTSVKNLNLVLNEKKDELSALEYIDLRFGNKVFYK